MRAAKPFCDRKNREKKLSADSFFVCDGNQKRTRRSCGVYAFDFRHKQKSCRLTAFFPCFSGRKKALRLSSSNSESVFGNYLSFTVGKIAADDFNQVNQRADSEQAARQEPKNARAGLAYIKAMDSESAQKNRQQKRCCPILFGFFHIFILLSAYFSI